MANKYRKAGNNPLLIFFMQLDTDRTIINGFNRGRLLLVDAGGLIGRWVFSSSIESKQNVDWSQRGGVVPPTSSMLDGKFWEFHTKRLSQPGQFVDDGFLITFKGSTSYTTIEGGIRSEIMVHNDTNRKSSLGSLGCIIALSNDEWEDFCLGINQSVSHLPVVNLLTAYSY